MFGERVAKIETTLDYLKKRVDDFIDAADKRYAASDVVIELRKENDILRQQLSTLNQELNTLKRFVWTAIGGGAVAIFVIEVAIRLWL